MATQSMNKWRAMEHWSFWIVVASVVVTVNSAVGGKEEDRNPDLKFDGFYCWVRCVAKCIGEKVPPQ